MVTQDQILNALKDVNDPELQRSVVELDMVRDIVIEGNSVSLTVVLTIAGCPLKAKIEDDIVGAIKALGVDDVKLTFGTMTDEERAKLAAQLRGGNQQPQGQAQFHGGPAAASPLAAGSKTTFIAVTSGKGGVGKSTVTVNLAVALARQGKKVGIIDADIYGFSVPDMMGIEQRPTVIDDIILPVERHGVKVMSMGFFVEDNAPVIWRGPMLGKMLRNFFNEVHWGELDYLLLDLPPGTGDVALDVHTMIPQSKEILVTTPHATAAFVAARAGAMAIRTNHEILGIVENMAFYECSSCGNKDYVFGRGGGERLAQELHSKVLVQLPLGAPEAKFVEGKDFSPSVYDGDSRTGKLFDELAQSVIQSN